MNDLDDRRTPVQPRPDERVERDRGPERLTGLEWLVRQAQRQRGR
ncbi:hypothetical protein [Saccharothrix obliqua]|nr:hypothetical protein [Saccharothrix obliqua]